MRKQRNGSRPLRVACYTRVATGGELNGKALRLQFDAVRAALPAGARIVVWYSDVGPGWPSRPDGDVQTGLVQPEPGCGGMAGLLARTRHLNRGFDAVACSSFDRLSPHPRVAKRIECALAEAGVLLLTANEHVGIAPQTPRRCAGQPRTTVKSELAGRRR